MFCPRLDKFGEGRFSFGAGLAKFDIYYDQRTSILCRGFTISWSDG